MSQSNAIRPCATPESAPSQNVSSVTSEPFWRTTGDHSITSALPIVVACVTEHGDAAATHQPELHARTSRVLNGRRSRRRYRREYLVVLGERSRVPASYVLHVLEPRARLCVDD